MIAEDYVSFEVAKLLKEKGFDEKCHCFYRKKLVDNKIVDKEELFVSANLMLTNSELEDKSYRNIVYCSVPTLQMTMKWLIEVHNIYINLDIHWLHFANSKGWMYTIERILENGIEYVDSKGDENDKTFYLTYEEACESAIRYTLENLI